MVVYFHYVTPFVGVWIEILLDHINCCDSSVTPFVGVWIEIKVIKFLKTLENVTPFVGVWIEISFAISRQAIM